MFLLVLLACAATALSGCAKGPDASSSTLSPAERDAQILAIADQFAASGDRQAAEAALDKLGLEDPAQAVLVLAEAYIAQRGEPEMTRRLVQLAGALGPLSRMASDYLAAASSQPASTEGQVAVAADALPTPTFTPLPPTATPTPLPPTDTPTATPEPTMVPTDTPVPAPRVAADAQGLNVRSGPGTAYPVIDEMAAGASAEIIGRNADGSWWQVVLANGTQGWVKASLVSASGPLDGVEIAQAPALPPTSTPRPAPTQAPPAAPAAPPPAPKPSTAYIITGFRLRPVGQDAQRCDGGDHNIFVLVVDPAGNPIDGVRVQEAYTGIVHVTGDQGKGPGRVEYDIYRGGGGVVQIVDDNNTPISPQSRGMSADWPPFDLMLEAGYCGCKPHPDPESCRADLENKGYLFAVGHYVYEVTFQRQY